MTVSEQATIYVAGHQGMVGSAIVRALQAKGYANIVRTPRSELDLLDQKAVLRHLERVAPDYIFVAAAKVGGIHANNSYRADFLVQNLMIETNLLSAAHAVGVQRVMFLGSSCIYPRDCPQPIREEYLLTGALEKTNEPYAIAKIAGIKLAEAYHDQYGRNYISVMPTNLYGLGDNYHPENSHVLPALIRRAHEAKVTRSETLTVWGSGALKREFLYSDDLADACVFLMETSYQGSLLNIGTGRDISIAELAQMVSEVVGFSGRLEFDTSRPDGTPRKLLDVSRMSALGWAATTPLREGIGRSYYDFLSRLQGRRH